MATTEIPAPEVVRQVVLRAERVSARVLASEASVELVASVASEELEGLLLREALK